MAEKTTRLTTPDDTKFDNSQLRSIFRTSRKVIEEYAREIQRYNTYKTIRGDSNYGNILDDRGPLIDLYEACIQQDNHLKNVVETLESQVLGERYMLAKQNSKGKYIKDVKATNKIQGTQFIKIIKGILEAKLYGYTLIELGRDVHPMTGRLTDVNVIERRNVLPDQKYVTQRQGFYFPGWDITSPQYADDYILINNGDLGMFSSTTPSILAKKFTFANYVNFTQTYGQPLIQGKCEDENPVAKSGLANKIAESVAQRIVVTGLNDEIDIHTLTSSNSERIFLGLMEWVNAEVSNLVLGSESIAGATQSYVGATNAHQDVFRDRIEVYREFIENVMNEEIIPRLQKRGYIEEGLEFKYSNRIEMNNADRIKLYDVLTSKYEISPEEIEKEFGVIVENQKDLTPNSAANKKEPVNFLTGGR